MTVRDLPPTASSHIRKAGANASASPNAALVFILVFGACMFGIGTRSVGFLAAFWPANALLLGLFVRNPQFATPLGWLAAFAAYIAADLMTGSPFNQTVLLTCGNLVPVGVGYALYTRVRDDDRRLKRPFSVLYLTLISAAAAASASIVGAIANPLVFGGSALQGMLFWSVTEFVNFIVLLPVALTVRPPRWPGRGALAEIYVPQVMRQIAPVLALIPSCLAGWWIGGPGALAFPVPALLWCALVYNVAGTAFITLLVSSWMLIGISTGAIVLGSDIATLPAIMSLRMGVALMALAPLNVASVMAAKREFQILLQRMVTNDPLTAALSRRAFMVRARNQLCALDGNRQPISVLMFDIDGLQEINQRHGHATGDQALKTLVRIARAYLPGADNLGRVGSDEFAILVTKADHCETEARAEGICEAFHETPIPVEGGGHVHVTASVGVFSVLNAFQNLDLLLNAAENSLNEAKKAKQALSTCSG